MMTMLYRFLPLFLPFLATTLAAQDAAALVRRVDAAIAEVATLSYTATMRMQGFSGADAEPREARVYLRRNPLDTIYHFDWEVVTDDANGIQHFIFLQGQYYHVNRKFAFVVCERLERIPRSSYVEFVRWTAVADELLHGLEPWHGPGAVLLPEGVAEVQGPALAFEKTAEQRLVVVDTATYMPRLVRTTMTEDALGVRQIFETEMSGVNVNGPQPDTVFHPQHYVNQGYSFRYAQPKGAADKSPPFLFSEEALATLLAAPLLSAEDDTLTLADLQHDGPLLLDFWYLACGPCQKAIPKLNGFAQEYGGRGLKVVGINGHDLRERVYVVGKLREKGVVYDQYFVDRALLNTLDIRAFPTFLLLDAQRRLKFSGIGLQADLEKYILEVLE